MASSQRRFCRRKQHSAAACSPSFNLPKRRYFLTVEVHQSGLVKKQRLEGTLRQDDLRRKSNTHSMPWKKTFVRWVALLVEELGGNQRYKTLCLKGANACRYKSIKDLCTSVRGERMDLLGNMSEVLPFVRSHLQSSPLRQSQRLAIHRVDVRRTSRCPVASPRLNRVRG